MRKTVRYLFYLLLFIIIACAPSLYEPHLEDPVVQAKLLAGRKLYIEKCSGCHNLFLPEQFREDQWERNLEEMQQRAMIDDEQKKSIQDYLVFKSKGTLK